MTNDEPQFDLNLPNFVYKGTFPLNAASPSASLSVTFGLQLGNPITNSNFLLQGHVLHTNGAALKSTNEGGRSERAKNERTLKVPIRLLKVRSHQTKDL